MPVSHLPSTLSAAGYLISPRPALECRREGSIGAPLKPCPPLLTGLLMPARQMRARSGRGPLKRLAPGARHPPTGRITPPRAPFTRAGTGARAPPGPLAVPFTARICARSPPPAGALFRERVAIYPLVARGLPFVRRRAMTPLIHRRRRPRRGDGSVTGALNEPALFADCARLL